MIELDLSRARRLLCLGAHSDDIEIGCGGTLLRLIGENPDLEVRWIVFAAAGDRRGEAQKSAEAWLAGVSQSRIELYDFRESYFPQCAGEIKNEFELLKRNFSPDLIFSHHSGDFHQDHRTLAELTWNSFRDHLILEYEIPKWDGDLGRPNVFFPLSESAVRTKIDRLLSHFATQASRDWFSEDTFTALLRLRGMECRAPSHYAEAFHARKLVLTAV